MSTIRNPSSGSGRERRVSDNTEPRRSSETPAYPSLPSSVNNRKTPAPAFNATPVMLADKSGGSGDSRLHAPESGLGPVGAKTSADPTPGRASSINGKNTGRSVNTTYEYSMTPLQSLQDPSTNSNASSSSSSNYNASTKPKPGTVGLGLSSSSESQASVPSSQTSNTTSSSLTPVPALPASKRSSAQAAVPVPVPSAQVQASSAPTSHQQTPTAPSMQEQSSNKTSTTASGRSRLPASHEPMDSPPVEISEYPDYPESAAEDEDEDDLYYDSDDSMYDIPTPSDASKGTGSSNLVRAIKAFNDAASGLGPPPDIPMPPMPTHLPAVVNDLQPSSSIHSSKANKASLGMSSVSLPTGSGSGAGAGPAPPGTVRFADESVSGLDGTRSTPALVGTQQQGRSLAPSQATRTSRRGRPVSAQSAPTEPQTQGGIDKTAEQIAERAVASSGGGGLDKRGSRLDEQQQQKQQQHPEIITKPRESPSNRTHTTDAEALRLRHLALREQLAKSTNLSDWAPPLQRTGPADKSTIPNLPDLDVATRTANPISLIQHDLDFAARKLLNEKVFEDLLNDALGRHRFREFCSREEDTAQLDMWIDVSALNRTADDVKDNSQALHDVYLANGALNPVQLPPELSQATMASIRQLAFLDSTLGDTQKHLLNSLYNNQFQRFVMSKLVEHAKVKLGKFNLTDAEREGLGDCFCLTNPRLKDHPIVLVSDGFTAVTGYPRPQIIGRNCRFLQGPGTSPEAVQRIRDGLNSGEGCTELLLNYRRDGQPFYCLLNILPLRDATGTLVYFIGGQVNVTGALADNKNLSFLIGGEPTDSLRSASIEGSPLSPTHSPSMLAYKNGHNLSSGNLSTSGSIGSPSRAAGSVEPGKIEPLSTSPTTNANLSPKPQRSRGLGALFGLGKRQTDPSNFGVQKVLGAEGVLGSGGAKPIEEQFSYFQETYSKAIVFKRDKREVIFVTPQLLAYFGLPFSTPSELFSSPIIHSDLLDFISAGEKSETKKLRAHLKQTIKSGGTLSVMCGMKFMGGNKYFGKNEYLKHKFGILHITPLKDRDGDSVAYVGVLG